MRRLARALAAAALLALAVPAAAAARDPGRWVLVRVTDFPANHNQGIASHGRSVFFDGALLSFAQVFADDLTLRQTAAGGDPIPADVRAGEGYNHIGDLSWDPGDGGRLVLPLECYTPGGPNGGNTCGTGAFAAFNPVSLAWSYYVKLDPADIPKAMWVESSPDGKSLWTSAGNDLLAYSSADVSAAHAGPAGGTIRPVRRLAGAVPPSGITGAAFHGGRLLLAGSDGGRFEVWSVDRSTGKRRLEIERRVNGESEGLDAGVFLGGSLHWQILPFGSGKPTYPNTGALLSFVPAGLLRIRVSAPKHVPAGRRRVPFSAAYVLGGKRWPLAGARISFAGRRGKTDRSGRVSIEARVAPGRYTAQAALKGFRGGQAAVRVR